MGIGYFWNWVDRKQSDKLEEDNGAPSHDFYYLPMQCQHCDNPECVTVCPTGASMKMDNGTVQIDKDQCIGCQACVGACPYGVRYLNVEKNVVEKCTLCSHLEEKDGLTPMCVRTCSAGARFWGDFDDPESDVNKALADYAEEDVHTLPDSGNEPRVRYILPSSRADWHDEIETALQKDEQ